MLGPFSLEEFAKLTGLAVENIERYRAAGLLDPDGDEVFDDNDALRVLFLLTFPPDHPLEDIRRQIEEGAQNNRTRTSFTVPAGRRTPSRKSPPAPASTPRGFGRSRSRSASPGRS